MRFKPVAFLGALFFPLWAFSAPLDFSGLFVFGDSLSDAGNANIITLGQAPGPNYAGGRFTDGAGTNPATHGPFGVWVDQFAAKINVPDPAPFLDGGTNYAVGGADSGSNGFYFVGDQVQVFLAGHSAAPSNALYTFWAGANDIADGLNPTTAANNIYSDIQLLSKAGAKYFVWLNLPPLGFTPKSIAGGTTTLANAASEAFNAQWQTDVYALTAAGIDVVGVDIGSLFNLIAADYRNGCTPGPTDAYCFANIDTPAQGKSGVDPNTYLFWDEQHPTTAAHGLVADAVYADLSAAPEPVAASLTFIGLGTLAVFAMYRRGKLRA